MDGLLYFFYLFGLMIKYNNNMEYQELQNVFNH